MGEAESRPWNHYWDWYDNGPGSERWKREIKVDYMKAAQQQTREKLRELYDTLLFKYYEPKEENHLPKEENHLPDELFEI